MRNQNIKAIKGLTLIEVMVSVFILFVVLEGLYLVMTTGHRSWYIADTEVSLQQDLRKALWQITADLYHSGPNQMSVLADGIVYHNVSFNVSEGITAAGAINWSSNPIAYGLTGSQIIRTEGGQTKIIANNITGFDLWRMAATSDIVRLNITAQRATVSGQLINASLDSVVLLRN